MLCSLVDINRRFGGELLFLTRDRDIVQGDQKVYVHLMITVQNTSRNI
jgi:hypothetical protein